MTKIRVGRLRRRVEDWLPDVAAVRRKTVVSDGAGGQLESWSTVLASVGCYVTNTSPTDLQRLGQERVSEGRTVKIVFPAETVIRLNDEIVVSGTTYRILDPGAPLSYAVDLETLAVMI